MPSSTPSGGSHSLAHSVQLFLLDWGDQRRCQWTSSGTCPELGELRGKDPPRQGGRQDTCRGVRLCVGSGLEREEDGPSRLALPVLSSQSLSSAGHSGFQSPLSSGTTHLTDLVKDLRSPTLRFPLSPKRPSLLCPVSTESADRASHALDGGQNRGFGGRLYYQRGPWGRKTGMGAGGLLSQSAHTGAR